MSYAHPSQGQITADEIEAAEEGRSTTIPLTAISSSSLNSNQNIDSEQSIWSQSA